MCGEYKTYFGYSNVIIFRYIFLSIHKLLYIIPLMLPPTAQKKELASANVSPESFSSSCKRCDVRSLSSRVMSHAEQVACACERFSIEQWVFICNTFTKYPSWTKCSRNFCTKYSASAVPCKKTIHATVQQFWTGSANDINKIRKHCLLT